MRRTLDWVATSTIAGTPVSANLVPPAWLQPPRKAVEHANVIKWDVPRARLVDAMSNPASTHSEKAPPVYLSATGVQLALNVRKIAGEPNTTHFDVFIGLCDYIPPGMSSPLCTATAAGLPVSVTITHQLPEGRQPAQFDNQSVTLSTEIGVGSRVFSAGDRLDLEPHLVDGCLKLEATLRVLPNPAAPDHPMLAAGQV
jgi:hypothetical protein